MFLQLCVCSQEGCLVGGGLLGGGGCLVWGRVLGPGGPGGVPGPGECLVRGGVVIPACTEADGTHPTGMHSCLIYF